MSKRVDNFIQWVRKNSRNEDIPDIQLLLRHINKCVSFSVDHMSVGMSGLHFKDESPKQRFRFVIAFNDTVESWAKRNDSFLKYHIYD